MAAQVLEMDIAELNKLVARLQQASEFNLSLTAEDIKLLLSLLATLLELQSQLSNKDITIHKLRKLLGMARASERLKDLIPVEPIIGTVVGAVVGEAANDETPKDVVEVDPPLPKIPRNKRTYNAQTIEPAVVFHPIEGFKVGALCIALGCEGTLVKYAPVEFIRVTGHAPFCPEKHVLSRLRCSACGKYYVANLPEDVQADGDKHQKYGYSARTIMVMGKYYMGSPFYRQEGMQSMLGFKLSASTIYDQSVYVADALGPIYVTLQRELADADILLRDDTTHRILGEKECIIPDRKTGKDKVRTGVYASGILGLFTKSKLAISLFNTNIGHAGEFTDEVLFKRTFGLPLPILMSDALGSNHVSVAAHISLCNAHGRRQFVDVLSSFKRDVTWVLEEYKHIWINETHIKNEKMLLKERLDYHKRHSLPRMQTILDWGVEQFANKTVEENSGLGLAIRYFNKHFDGLTCFCRVEGAPIDNNRMEGVLKIIVRNRKNAYFYKTQDGADVSDIITSVISTCAENGINPVAYINFVQQHAKQVALSPQDFLPWNYQESVLFLKKAA